MEAAKVQEQVRYQPLIGALDTVFKNCQAQTQALAQAQAQLIAQRATLTSDGVRGRMSSGGSLETMGSWLNGLAPGAGDGLQDFGRAERNAAMAEFERQALATMPNIQLESTLCGDDPAALLNRMGIASPLDSR